MFLVFLVGTGLLVGSILCHGLATAFIVHLTVRLIRRGYAAIRFGKNVAVMMIVSLATVAAHLTQIALWAVAFGRDVGKVGTEATGGSL